MAKLNKDNFRKAFFYLKKNGVKNTVLATMERLTKGLYDDYTYTAPSFDVLKSQKETVWDEKLVFSVVVPVYKTPLDYYKQMIESLLAQTYPYFELILADASKDEALRKIAEGYGDERIRYVELSKNAGISANTNEAISYATGDYIALLDHDDFLTPDALFEMRMAAEKKPVLIYSDEDKCDGDGKRFYEPHFKLDFNLDLLLSNNYICHFSSVRADVMKTLMLRPEYDGAQDFDLMLRIAASYEKKQIVHIGKVLYHWRCHTGSTAANPESKRYAYEAGKRAIEDFLLQKGWDATVSHTKHLGFYHVTYTKPVWEIRPEVIAVGGPIYKEGKIVSGALDKNGYAIYVGLRKGFSGYMHRASLWQQVEALDLRNVTLSPQGEKVLQEAEETLQCLVNGDNMERVILSEEKTTREDPQQMKNRIFARLASAQGYVLLYRPQE